jgi:hypothetical protein
MSGLRGVIGDHLSPRVTPMPSRETVLRFVGGPLDGEERRKTRPARLSLFLTDAGDPLRAAVGDRIASAAHGAVVAPRGGPASCYRLLSDETTADRRRTVTYAYTTTERTS